MTCGGCKLSVEKYLEKVNYVTNVDVDLEKAEAQVTMNQHIETETLKNALPEKYHLSERHEQNVFSTKTIVSERDEEKNKIEQLPATTTSPYCWTNTCAPVWRRL